MGDVLSRSKKEGLRLREKITYFEPRPLAEARRIE
jgi:hypothetical protein